VAVRARTGKLVWFTSLVGHDVRDYDAASPVVLLPARRDGAASRAVGEAGKSGRYYILDAATGRPLFSPVPFVTAGPGQPAPAGQRAGTRECPGELGGSNYSPVAYSPDTHAAYVSGINYCTVIHPAAPGEVARHRAGEPDLGGSAAPAVAAAPGTFSAVDTDTGRLLWQRAMPAPMLGGATATAGGLVLAGGANGILYAFDSRSGRIRWQENLGAGFGSAPVAYAIGGREYLAVVSGGAAISAINGLGPVGARLVVFTLPGGR
jgi:glucose dehydrogenase